MFAIDRNIRIAMPEGVRNLDWYTLQTAWHKRGQIGCFIFILLFVLDRTSQTGRLSQADRDILTLACRAVCVRFYGEVILHSAIRADICETPNALVSIGIQEDRGSIIGIRAMHMYQRWVSLFLPLMLTFTSL